MTHPLQTRYKQDVSPEESHHTESGPVQTQVRVSVTGAGDALPQEQADGVPVEPRSTFLQGGEEHVVYTGDSPTGPVTGDSPTDWSRNWSFKHHNLFNSQRFKLEQTQM